MIKSKRLVNILSIVIPVAVGLMMGVRSKIDFGDWTNILPSVSATINGTTSIVLIAALIAIKSGNRKLHRNLMGGCLLLGALFLFSYIFYHLSHVSTKYGGEGAMMVVYKIILFSHIILAAVVVRFVLLAFYHAINEDFDQHKKTVKWAYPIWLYVSISGVVVYFMISPYYQF